MGIEGVGNGDILQKVLASGQQVLHIGHLSLLMMEGKVANGEWRWIDEPSCSMHTATNKPALLRPKLRANLGVDLRVLRHEKFLQGHASSGEGEAAEAAESVGDLIIFDMDKADVEKEVGNVKVFCQDPTNYDIAPFESLAPEMRAAVDRMLALELVQA